MNKTITIALAGFSFTIEEQAYVKLSNYLSALKNALEQDEAEEVMYDIESRIVEIFKESLGKREVVNEMDVEKVIALIGKPEEIEGTEETHSQSQQEKGSYSKKLFRDPEHKKIAGVCAGLATYFGMDLVFMRIIWLILFLVLIPFSPIVLLTYLGLWLIVPKAQTASDFLRMRGEPLSFDNLKNESNKIMNFVNESSQRISKTYRENDATIKAAGSSIANAIRYTIGGLLLFFGLIFLSSIFMIVSASITGMNVHLPGFVGFLISDYDLKYTTLGLVFVTLLIPALIFIFLGVKILFPKSKLKYVGYSIIGLVFVWLIMIAAVGFSVMKYKSLYKGTNEDQQTITINTPSDTLSIGTNRVIIPSNFGSHWEDVYTDQKTVYQKGENYVNITRKKGLKTPYLIIKQSASGYNLPLQLTVPVKMKDNELLIPNYIYYPYEDRKRIHKVSYELVVPNKLVINKIKGSKVILEKEKDTFWIDDDYSNHSHTQHLNDEAHTEFIYNFGANSFYFSDDDIFINGKEYDEDEAVEVIKKMGLEKDELESILVSLRKRKE